MLRRDAGWIECGDVGLAVERWGHAVLERPREVEDCISFSEESTRDLVRSFCCLTDSCSERSSEACCCEAARRKELAEAMEFVSLSMGSLNLFAILSMSLAESEDATSSSP